MFLEFKAEAFYRTDDIRGSIEKMGISWAEFRDALGLSEIVTGGLFGFQIIEAAKGQMYAASGACSPSGMQRAPEAPQTFDPPNYENPGLPPVEE